MAELATFIVQRNGDQTEIRLSPIPDSLEDEDEEVSGYGISFGRRDTLHFAWILIRAALRR